MMNRKGLEELTLMKEVLERALKDEKDLGMALEREAMEKWMQTSDDSESIQIDEFRHIPHLHQTLNTTHTSELKETLSESLHIQPWRCQTSHSTILNIKDSQHVTKNRRMVFHHLNSSSIYLSFDFTQVSPLQSSENSKHPGSSRGIIKDMHITLSHTSPTENENDILNLMLLDSEADGMFKHLEADLDFEKIFRATDEYVEKSKRRFHTLDELDESSKVTRVKDGVLVTVSGARGKVACKMLWKFEYQPKEEDFREIYNVQFTSLGAQLAEDCGFPSELRKNGHLEEWNASYCLENISKMASLDFSHNSTPVKRVKK